MTLTPAYGRDYKSKKEVLEAFHNNQDFILNSIAGTGICNKKDLEEMESNFVNIRYKKLTQIVVVKI
jgi:hypothetical protein